MRSTAIAMLLVLVAPAPAADSPRGYPGNVCSLQELVRMNGCQLLDLYRRAEPGPVPAGYAPGRVIPNPGKIGNDPLSKLIQCTVWQGKHFDSDGMMTNKQFGIRTNRGHVYPAKSLVDGKPVHVIDYHESWRVWRPFLDEFREVSPGIYLGITWKMDGGCARFFSYFAIDARRGCCQRWDVK